MSKLLYLGAALVAFMVIINAYGNARYNAGKITAEKICETERQHAQQQDEEERYKDDIKVRRLSVDDVVDLLSKRGELRD